ncbi:hypothetical protein KIW84_040421 [Lathyrus oleraceus]|uniref:Uncharacterized protein n=1 Tax=Pisum sativum TaxID=3888 RepID=A0A9D4X577_PEA|nr:hypothetical protein KIW84_040421 [Pisum sativum]
MPNPGVTKGKSSTRQAKRDIHAHQLQTTIAPIQNGDVQTSKIQAPSSNSPVDTNNLNVEMGKFARICMEIDLTLQVFKKVNVNGHWFNVQYEVAQPSGLLENNVVNEQRLMELHQEVGEDNSKVLAKETREINAVHGDWLVV